MVGAEGFEPPTLCSQSRCATRLRYAPTLLRLYREMLCDHPFRLMARGTKDGDCAVEFPVMMQ
jgi:hypothetical protein